MPHTMTALLRSHRLVTIAVAAGALCIAVLVGVDLARAETTTSTVETTAAGGSTTTAAGETPATTTAGQATATTTAGDVTTTTGAGQTAAAGEGLTPAPAGFEAPNPGLLAAQLGVQFWPEYDTNDVLVLLDVTLPATTVFPYEFSFFVPTGARLAGLAEIDENGKFLYTLGTPRITSGPLMDKITVRVPTRTVLRLEYYYDPGVGAPGPKSFTVAFQAPADAGQLSVGVQQPLGATGFSAGTLLTETTTDGSGFTYAFGTFSGVKAGDLIQIPVSYTRSDPDPSVPPGDAGSDPTQQKNSSYLLWLLIVLVLAVGGIVAYRLFFRREPASSQTRSRPARSGGTGNASSTRSSGGRAAGTRRGSSGPGGSGKGPVGDAGAGPVRFCTECGGRLGKKDRFCPQCGHERES